MMIIWPARALYPMTVMESRCPLTASSANVSLNTLSNPSHTERFAHRAEPLCRKLANRTSGPVSARIRERICATLLAPFCARPGHGLGEIPQSYVVGRIAIIRSESSSGFITLAHRRFAVVHFAFSATLFGG